MSTLIVPVTTVDEIKAHPNADRLEVATILGWSVVVGKGSLQAGDEVLYVPPDALVPREWGEHWGVWKYLSVRESDPDHGRTRAVKLRGEPSFGFAVPLSRDRDTLAALSRTGHRADMLGYSDDIPLNYADTFTITKYEPPIRTTAGDAMPEHPLFSRYTEIENLRNFPHLFSDNEPVVITEKIHGTNCRVGLIDGEWMAGSHKLQRAEPEDYTRSDYWFPLSLPGVRALLGQLGQHHRQAILFGEVYGKVQSLKYGLPGKLGFAAFDLLIDGTFVPHGQLRALCQQYDVPTVPLLYHGPFSLETIVELSRGQTTLDDTHYREGVVVKPVEERWDETVGRVIAKYIGDQFLTGDADQTADV